MIFYPPENLSNSNAEIVTNYIRNHLDLWGEKGLSSLFANFMCSHNVLTDSTVEWMLEQFVAGQNEAPSFETVAAVFKPINIKPMHNDNAMGRYVSNELLKYDPKSSKNALTRLQHKNPDLCQKVMQKINNSFEHFPQENN